MRRPQRRPLSTQRTRVAALAGWLSSARDYDADGLARPSPGPSLPAPHCEHLGQGVSVTDGKPCRVLLPRHIERVVEMLAEVPLLASGKVRGSQEQRDQGQSQHRADTEPFGVRAAQEAVGIPKRSDHEVPEVQHPDGREDGVDEHPRSAGRPLILCRSPRWRALERRAPEARITPA